MKGEAASSENFSIGICATGSAENIGNLLGVIEKERLPEHFVLDQIVIVASECTGSSVDMAKDFAMKDGRVKLIEEEHRTGKASAINKIIEETGGSYLMLVNADALPKSGSIRLLLESIQKNESIGMVSGSPTFNSSGGATSGILELMWKVHNQCSLILNHKQISNHSSDELMVVRRTALSKLPKGLVNDGGFIANVASQRGFSIKFCEGATVDIDVPPRLVDIIVQRRRIMYGHMQVRRLTGRAPKTLESLLLIAPALSLGVAVSIFARFPKLLKVLPLAVVGEAVSFVLAVSDTLKSTNRHAVWKRYAD